MKPASRTTLVILAILVAVVPPAAGTGGSPVPESRGVPAVADGPGTLPAPADASVIPKDFYSGNSRFLDITEPIQPGLEAFRARLAGIRNDREPVGLVLSGGSARAFAHIGVLRAMEERGLRPDFIVANSMGAIVGMLYAAGFSPDSIERLVSGVSVGELLDPVLPLRGGFIDSGRFASIVRSVVGELDIADLPIPVMVILEDLETRRQVRMMEGDFARVIAASFALPAVFEPYRWGDHYLIDGGVTNLVPAAAAAEHSERVIVSATLYDRPMSFANPFTVINRAIDIGKTRTAVGELRELHPPVIRNDVEQVSYMEFAEPAGIVARGYVSAIAAMPGILAVMAPLPFDPGLGELRALYADRVAQTIERFARGIVPPDLRQSLVAPVLRIADHVEGDLRFHAGRRYLGFEVLNRYGLVTTGIGAGAGLEGDPGRLWNLHCSIGLKSGSGFVASVDARLSGGLRPIAAGFPVEPEHVELAGRAEYRFGGPGPVAAVFVVAEAGRRIDGSSTGWTASAGLNARTRKGSAVPAAARISGFVDSDGNAGPAWMLGLSSPATLDFGVRLRGQGRHSFAGPGTVPGLSDPFRGPGTAERAPSWLFVNSELVWRARALGFEAGEMIIVREVEVGPFLDLRLPFALPAAGETSRAAAVYGGWKSGSTRADVSGPERLSMEPAGSRAFAGLVLSASVSFMGLAPVDFSISAGVDTATGAPGISISGGRLFPP